MKNFKLLLLAAVCAATLLACEKEDPFQPATIQGAWVFSEANTGTQWKELNIDKLYYFDGTGAYTVKTLKSGISKVTFYNGKVYEEESSYELTDTKSYTVKCAGDKYKFESVSGDFVLTAYADGKMTFDFSSSTSELKGYKLCKVTQFGKSVTPDPPTPQEPDEPDVNTINGTKLDESNDLVGLVTDSATKKGIPGVVVSDGYDCVATDANGVYQFKSNSLTRLVFISTPSEYAVPVGSVPSKPEFYKAVKPEGEVIRTDFTLTPLAGGKETNWTFIGIGDPQCANSSNASRYSGETIPDIKKATSGKKSVYAMTLGDIVFDSTDMWPSMKTSMSSVYNGAWFIPFFQTIGNHDHDSLKPDTGDDAMDDYVATSTFTSVFGPTDYSFNRGDVHVVSMDDIIISSKKTSSKSNGYTWSYNHGFSDKQLAWLKKDLELVPDKQNKMIFICCHIPFRTYTVNHYPDVMRLMTEFKEAHLMIGHTHYTQNYIHTSYKTKNGMALYEHIHGSACGAWWTSSSSSTVTGEPCGYTIYDIEGAHIKDWHFKGTNRDESFQLRVFDGNEVYYQSKYPLNWYTASQKVGTYTFTVKGNANLKGCFVAQLFNDDDTYWTVELVKKSTGEKIGNFKRLSNGSSTNIAMSAYYYNAKSKSTDSYCSTTASHYWYYKPASATPALENDWEVVVTHKLPAGDVTHTYRCSTLTTESDLAKTFYF